jgi:ABC-type transporter Mla subunit MlaD
MVRPSKLTPGQWKELERRLLAGETARSLGREFGVSESGIRKRFGAHQSVSAQSAQVRIAAEKLADAQTALEILPVSQRQVAISLADDLREISRHLAGAARFGSATAHRLAGIAHAKVQEIDDAAPLNEASLEALRGVAALTRLANDAAATGLNLLKANDDTVKSMNDSEVKRAGQVTRIGLVPMAPAPERQPE